MPRITIEISSALEDTDFTDAIIEAIRQADSTDMVLFEAKSPVGLMATFWRLFREML